MRVSTSAMIQTAIDQMLRQQSDLARTQASVASGQKYSSAAENPGAVAAATRLDSVLSQIDQYRENANLATQRLSVEDGALSNVNDMLQRARELIVNASNATTSVEARDAIAVELKVLEEELLAIGNTQDGRGRYLFAGTADGSAPFSKAADGSIVYSGNDAERQVSIGTGRSVADSDSGADVFMRMLSGNGRFEVNAAPANTGGAVLAAAKVTTAADYTGGSFELRFNGGDYEVLDAAGSTVATGAYQAERQIEFAGVSVTFKGRPADGDSFDISPSRRTSIFELAHQATVATGNQNVGERGTQMFNLLQGLDEALGRINELRGSVGSRLNAIDRSDEANAGAQLEIARSLSGFRDVDMAEAISRLSQQASSLEAAQASFARIQNLSLFDFLR